MTFITLILIIILFKVATISHECYGGPIAVHSGKAKLNALSSGLPTALFLHELLTELGFPQDPIIVLEDSKSCTDATKAGKLSTGATVTLP